MVFEEFSSIKFDNNDEKFIEEFVTVYSRYLITNDFDAVKSHIADLARRGHVKSLAKYIRKVAPENWDEDLKEMAFSIKNGGSTKTPQEWEVVAAIDWHTPLQGCEFEKLKTIQDLRQELLNVGGDFYKADLALKKKRISKEKHDKILNYGKRIVALFEAQPYYESLRKCQEGYYSAFVENQNIIDGVGFLEHTMEPDDLFLPFDKMQNHGNGVIYSKNEIANVLIESFNAIPSNEECTNEDLFGFGFALILLAKNNREKNWAVRALNVTSRLPYTTKETTENRTKED